MIVSLLSFDISKGLIIRCVTQKVKYVTVGFFLNYATFETDDIFKKGKPGQHSFYKSVSRAFGFFSATMHCKIYFQLCIFETAFLVIKMYIPEKSRLQC